MNPIIQKLQSNYPEISWTEAGFSWGKTDIRSNSLLLSKLAQDHLLLSLDFSLLCQQIREQLYNLKANNTVALDSLKEQLGAAILFGELLERLYDENFLNVPAEVRRIKGQRKIHSQILSPNATHQPKPLEHELSLPEEKKNFLAMALKGWLLLKNWIANLSIAQWVRNTTFRSNLYRLLFARSRRLVETLQLANLGSKSFGKLIQAVNQVAMPFFTWLAWIFFLPRLLVSCFVLFKNTFYTPGMGEEQLALGCFARFCTQFKRRWFHLGNDLVWAVVGLLNCFLLTGVLAPIGAYLTLAAFAYDVILAVINVSVELYRLTSLRERYQQMEQTPEVMRHLAVLDERISFEAFRLGINVLSTIAILLSASLGLPFFASTPLFPLVGALLLVIISVVAFASNSVIEECRPNDALTEKELEPLQSKLGFFGQKKAVRPSVELEISLESNAIFIK